MGGALGLAGAMIKPLAKPVINMISPVLTQSGRDASVVRNLARGGLGAGQIQEPAIPGAPLTTAQATNNPAVAAKMTTAQGMATSNPTVAQAVQNLQQGQANAIRGELGKISPAATAPTGVQPAEASEAFAGSVRQANTAALGQERKLWQQPALAETKVTGQPVMASVMAAMQGLEPGLQAAVTPPINKLVGTLGNIVNDPRGATVRDINSIRSGFLRITRDHNAQPAERVVAGRLASSVLDGLDKVPEIAGSPEIPATPTSPGRPAMPPNPEISEAYQKARDFSRRTHEVLGSKLIKGTLRTETPSTDARRYFNFGYGKSEGADAVTQLSGLMKEIQHHPVSADLIQHARDFVVSSMMDMTHLGQSNFKPEAMANFLNKNSPMDDEQRHIRRASDAGIRSDRGLRRAAQFRKDKECRARAEVHRSGDKPEGT